LGKKAKETIEVHFYKSLIHALGLGEPKFWGETFKAGMNFAEKVGYLNPNPSANLGGY